MPRSLGPNRREVLIAFAATGGAALIAAAPRTVSGPPSERAISVLDHIPPALHASIRESSISADLERYFDDAAGLASRTGRALYVPAGTYTMATWKPPGNLTVLTAGRTTIFKQLDTSMKPTRLINVHGDKVSLWPGGSATIDGGMNAAGVNATSFNGGVYVYAGDGETIGAFDCGDIYGVDLGGDVLQLAAHSNGDLGHCEIGTIYGDNVYRNIVSITAGRNGHIAGVIQLGGVGLLGLDFEPDTHSGSAPRDWTFGIVRCHRAQFAGDAAVPIGRISGDQLDLSYTDHGPSRPAFDYGGVNARSSPALFEVGLRYRNCESVVIKRAVIKGFPRGAIVDIGEAPGDSYTKLFRCDYLELHNIGSTSNYEIVQQKTSMLSVGYLLSIDKPNRSTATLIGGTATDSVAEIDAGNIAGRLVATHTGQVRVGW